MNDKSNFEQARLKFVAHIEMGQSIPSSDYTRDTEDAIPFLQGSAEFGDAYPTPEVYTYEPSKRAAEGDILFSVRAPVGELNIADQVYGIGRGLCAIRPKPEHLDLRYTWWMLHAVRRDLRALGRGSTYEAVSVSDVANTYVPVPPLDVQRDIASRIDDEVRRLDALVEAKRALLETLAAKRRALVARAVTRGLDAEAPTRDSGHPWLGRIPAHWGVERLKFHLRSLEQGWSPSCHNVPAGKDEWGVLKVGAVNEWVFDPTENKRLPDDTEPRPELKIEEGDILMSRANTTELLGSASIVRSTPGKLLLCDKLYRLRLEPGSFVPEFLVRFLRSVPGHFEFERSATGASASMQNITQETVKNVWVVRPPLAEQRAIVAHLEAETAALARVRTGTQATVDLLRERRYALITAAVTGHLHTEEARA